MGFWGFLYIYTHIFTSSFIYLVYNKTPFAPYSIHLRGTIDFRVVGGLGFWGFGFGFLVWVRKAFDRCSIQ